MRVIVNPKYTNLTEEIENLPSSFEERGDIVYKDRNVLKRINLGGVDAVVKRFKKPHFINRIVYSFIRRSKAERSYIYSMKIQEYGFRIPEPIAMIENFRNGLLSDSYYISTYDNGETVRSLMDGRVEGNEDKLTAFARYTASLHQAGILHLDYSPGNILIHQDEEHGGYNFSLVDVNRMRLMPEIDCDTVCRNMCRLCISREVLAYIMKEYALLRRWDAESTVKLALHYSDKFFTGYIYRRAARRDKSKRIVSHVVLFRLYRCMHRLLGWEPHISSLLQKEEKRIYHKYLCKYDYCKLLYAEYQ